MLNKIHQTILSLAGLGLFMTGPVGAASVDSLAADSLAADSLESTVRQAVLDNPDVKASWTTFKAAKAEQRVAKGGYYPSVDVAVETGSERGDQPGALTSQRTYHRESSRFTLTQMLFDGFATYNDVARLGYAKLARYYELKSQSEAIALDAATAYIDVVRRRELVGFAEDNYIQHKLIFDDIKERVDAGVSRRVDLEQAQARLALAEINLLTETNNLYDVQVNFQRVVGRLPAEELLAPAVPKNLIPESHQSVLDRAYAHSPVLNSAIENLRSAKSELRGTNANFLPRLDLRVRHSQEKNIEGIIGVEDENAIELVASYNLYRGGSDSARKRQSHENWNTAKELRNSACRNVRQNVIVAYNNALSLQQQLEYLAINEESISKARTAYKKQFDIGQRSLLDLLDTENEYFDVRRSLTNARHDLMIAHARTLASMGLMLSALEINSIDQVEDQSQLNLRLNQDRGTLKNVCPASVPMPLFTDKQALLDKVVQARNSKTAARNARSLNGWGVEK